VGAEQEVKLFLARLDEPTRAKLAGSESKLASLVESGRGAWPGLSVPTDVFLSWVVERLNGGGTEGGEALKAGDLYLACACARAEPLALRIFEQQFVPEMGAALARLRMSLTEREELQQALRQKLLVAEGEQPPRIAAYAGRGDLRRWLRAVATREGLSLMRKDTPEVKVEEEFFDYFPTAAEDVELQHARREYQVEFKLAFEQALKTLSPEERNLIRRHFIDGLSTPQMATMYGLHRVTMFRRLKQACDALTERTRKLLEERLPLSSGELTSLNRLIRSQLDVSLERLLPPAVSREQVPAGGTVDDED
jgi:RNA polymerase sigma-70 factor (ECF subfamily)